MCDCAKRASAVESFREEQVLMVSVFSAGLNPNMNVNSIDVSSGVSVKDPSQSQSRLPQWTHPNSVGNLSTAASPLDQNPSKHGASALVTCHPQKVAPHLLTGWPEIALFFLCISMNAIPKREEKESAIAQYP